MDSLYLFLAGFLVAMLLSWKLLLGGRHAGRQQRREGARMDSEPQRIARTRATSTGGYKAVSIRICNSPCMAAMRLRKKTFLLGAQPPLPLPACDRSCHCDFQYHEDRRRKDDRRYPAKDLQLAVGAALTSDSRSGRDRRRSVAPYQGIY